MVTNPLIIINPDATDATRAEKYFKTINMDYVLCTHSDNMLKYLKNHVKNGHSDVIICGGDGSVNHFINSYMKLNSSERNKISLGIIPCGKANDLVRVFKIPTNIDKAYNIIKNKRTQNIDIIKVNGYYFVTGGCLGFGTDVASAVIKFSSTYLGRFFNRLWKHLTYFLFAIQKVFFGYCSVDYPTINGDKLDKKYMIIAIMNQSFIGKRFLLSPKSINNDGKLELVLVPKSNPMKEFNNINRITKGLSIKGLSCEEYNKVKIQIESKFDFMADGEIICKDDNFEFELITKAIKVYY